MLVSGVHHNDLSHMQLNSLSDLQIRSTDEIRGVQGGVATDSDVRYSVLNCGLSRLRGGKESACQRRRCERHGFNSWVGKIPWVLGMATHCSVLAWRIPWTAEPGGLQSAGSQRDALITKNRHG